MYIYLQMCVWVCVVRPQKGLASNFCLLFSMVVPLSLAFPLSMVPFCRNVNTLHILFRPRHEIDELCPLPVTCFNGSHGCPHRGQEELQLSGVTLVVGRTSFSRLDSGANKLWRQEVCTNTSDYKERRVKGEGWRVKREEGREPREYLRVTRITFLVSELIDSYANVVWHATRWAKIQFFSVWQLRWSQQINNKQIYRKTQYSRVPTYCLLLNITFIIVI